MSVRRARRPGEEGVGPAGERRLRTSRVALIAAGALLLALAAAPGSGGLLAIGGTAMLLAALGLRPLVRHYGQACILIVNTALLLVAIELGATALLRAAQLDPVRALVARLTGTPNDLIRHYLDLPYYVAQPWSDRYWTELRAALRKRYAAYVVWRSPAFRGELIRIDDDGVRRTPGADCRSGAFRVFAFGGSAMWGWGSPDWGTIPAYLQRELATTRPGPVCVVNFGEQAFVSTQSAIQLLTLLQRGDVPDLVVFYDGVNEVLAASQTRRSGLHQNLSEIAARFDHRPGPLDSLRLLGTPTLVGRLLAVAASPEHAAPMQDPEALANAVVDAYLVNLRTVADWAARYGFSSHFFWQPHVLIGAKPLAREERAIVGGLDWVLPLTDELRALFAAAQARIGEEARRDAKLHDLAHVFDGVPDPVWIDTWGHVAPPGNERVAREIARVLSAAPAARNAPDAAR